MILIDSDEMAGAKINQDQMDDQKYGFDDDTNKYV
jgi:hypothetical protein